MISYQSNFYLTSGNYTLQSPFYTTPSITGFTGFSPWTPLPDGVECPHCRDWMNTFYGFSNNDYYETKKCPECLGTNRSKFPEEFFHDKSRAPTVVLKA